MKNKTPRNFPYLSTVVEQVHEGFIGMKPKKEILKIKRVKL